MIEAAIAVSLDRAKETEGLCRGDFERALACVTQDSEHSEVYRREALAAMDRLIESKMVRFQLELMLAERSVQP